MRAQHTIPANGPFWPQLARRSRHAHGPGAEQTAHAASKSMPAHCAHPSAHSCAQRPCPWRGTARARPPDPLSLRADVLDDVETCSSSIESAKSTRTMVGTSVESLPQTHDSEEPPGNPARARQFSGGMLRIWAIYAPFSSSSTRFESMVTGAQRVALGTRF